MAEQRTFGPWAGSTRAPCHRPGRSPTPCRPSSSGSSPSRTACAARPRPASRPPAAAPPPRTRPSCAPWWPASRGPAAAIRLRLLNPAQVRPCRPKAMARACTTAGTPASRHMADRPGEQAPRTPPGVVPSAAPGGPALDPGRRVGADRDRAGGRVRLLRHPGLPALRGLGLRVVLVNSNPATIMTDPEVADATYLEPLTLARWRPCSRPSGPTTPCCPPWAADGPQPGRGPARERHPGAARGRADRGHRRRRPPGRVAGRVHRDLPGRRLDHPVGVESSRWPTGWPRSTDLGLPVVIRPSFTLGGWGGGIARTAGGAGAAAGRGPTASPVGRVLIEESVLGWKEFELKVMRDWADNAVVVCSIENVDPMGVYTGDSVTVAPQMTLSDREYQRCATTP